MKLRLKGRQVVNAEAKDGSKGDGQISRRESLKRMGALALLSAGAVPLLMAADGAEAAPAEATYNEDVTINGRLYVGAGAGSNPAVRVDNPSTSQGAAIIVNNSGAGPGLSLDNDINNNNALYIYQRNTAADTHAVRIDNNSQGPTLFLNKKDSAGSPDVLSINNEDDGIGLYLCSRGGSAVLLRLDAGNPTLENKAYIESSGAATLGGKLTVRGGIMVADGQSADFGNGNWYIRHDPNDSSYLKLCTYGGFKFYKAQEASLLVQVDPDGTLYIGSNRALDDKGVALSSYYAS